MKDSKYFLKTPERRVHRRLILFFSNCLFLIPLVYAVWPQAASQSSKPSEEHESLVRDSSVYPLPYEELGWDADAADVLNPKRLGYHSSYLLEKYGDRIATYYRGHEEAFTILYTTLGYDPDRIKHAIIRQTKLGRDKNIKLDEENSTWKLLTYRGNEVASGKPEYFGKFMGMEYWIIDFSNTREAGEGYRIETEIKTPQGYFDVSFKSEPFDIQKNLLVQRTAYGVGVANFHEPKIVRHVNPLGDPYLGKGFMDCNGNLSEVRHHVWVIFGLADLLKAHGEYMGTMAREALISDTQNS